MKDTNSSSNENKYRMWVFTWNETPSSDATLPALLPSEKDLRDFLHENCEDYVFQLEQGEVSGKLHYQGCFKTLNRVRHSTLLSRFVQRFSCIHREDLCINLTIDRMQATWTESVTYCTKAETRVGNIISMKKAIPYSGEDTAFLDDESKRYPWQNFIYGKVFENDKVSIVPAGDREIYWIFDPWGNSGKSKFVKYLCTNNSDVVKVSFGTAAQLRSSIISIGPKAVYLIDTPRTLDSNDSIPALISTLEDIKNGFVVSSFYGKHQQLLMDPPHVIVFSNKACPQDMLSKDRWLSYKMTRELDLEISYDFF